MTTYDDFSFENILRQNDRLMVALTEAFTKLKADGRFTTDSIKQSEIPEILFDHTGLTIDFLVTDKIRRNAYVVFPFLDKNHPFFGDFIRNVANADLGVGLVRVMDTVPQGSVNPKTCRVDGIFSKLKSDIYMSVDLLQGKFYTAEEAVAVFLHEVGHIFTYYFFLGTVVRSSLVTVAAAKACMEIDGSEERVKVLKEAERTLGVEVNDIERVASADVRVRGKLIQSVFLSAEAQKMRVETGNNYYELRACEQLADQFAVFHGAGPHLATALLKLKRDQAHSSYNPWPVHIMVEVCKLLMFACGLFFMPVPLVAYVLLANPLAKKYDDPEQRVRMIRQNIIIELKSKDIESNRIRELNEQLAVVQQVEDSLEDKLSLMELFWVTIMPSGREAERQVIAQKRIENLINSELFSKAANFRLLGENQ